jgi:hypothetical protein
LTGEANDRLIIDIHKAQYRDQALSQFILDYPFDKPTASVNSLREFLLKEYSGQLPYLNDRRLANTLGSTVLLSCLHEGTRFPLLVRRSANVGIMPFGWHATSSSAVGWPQAYRPKESFEEFVHNWTLRHIESETGIRADEITFLLPIAFCREWLRAGKPEILFVGETSLSWDELRKRINKEAGKVSIDPIEVQRFPWFKRTPMFRDVGALTRSFVEFGLTIEGAYSYYYYLKWINARENGRENGELIRS